MIADLSVNYVERLILRCGWVGRRIYPDYGIDMYMETYNHRGEVENDVVWFQVKATEAATTLKGDKGPIVVRLDWRDLLYWLNERLPAILVVYEASSDRAWWLHLQMALRAVRLKIGQRPPDSVTLHVPLENCLDESAIRHFAKLRDAAIGKKGGTSWSSQVTSGLHS